MYFGFQQAHLIQQQTEATRNILGGGIPLHLPADTPEVAAGKQAHAIAHENQKLATSGYYAPLNAGYAGYVTPAIAATPLAAPIAARIAAAPIATPAIGSPYAYSYATPYSVAAPYYAGYGLAGLRTIY